MQLSKRQEAILIGLILGDGCLEKNGKNVRLRVEHGLAQTEYLRWLYEEFKNISPQKPRIVSAKHSKNGKFYERVHLSTFSLECLNHFYFQFYKDRKKVIPKEIENILIKPISLAIWFMDDGYKRNDCNALRIGTDSFSYQDQQKLIKCLENNFKIVAKLHRKTKNWNIYIPQKEAKKFCFLIKPFIVPSMEYKINLTP